MKLTDSHFGVRSAVLQRHERPASRHHGKGSRHSSPNRTSTLKARSAYKKCRRLLDVKNVGQSLQVPREDAQEELCRKLRTNCGVVKFCSLAHKATPFGAMKKLAPWSVVLMLLQLDTGAGCVKARFFFCLLWLLQPHQDTCILRWLSRKKAFGATLGLNELNLSCWLTMHRCEGKLAKHVYLFGMWAVIKLKTSIC